MELRAVLDKYFKFQEPDNLPRFARPIPREASGRTHMALVMRDMGFCTGVEVGTRSGASAELWCTTIPGLRLSCVDPYLPSPRISERRQEGYYEQARKNAEKYGFTLMRCRSLEAVDRFGDGSLDFAYIDGDHAFDAVVQDIIRWAPKVREGGLVLVHDYCTLGLSGVMTAVNSYTHCHWIDPWYVTRDMEPTAFWQRGAERAGIGS